MADIFVRGVGETQKKNLSLLAATLGVSLNTLCMWILEEASMPYDELRVALFQRAEEVHSSKPTYDVYPSPKHPTQPMKKHRPIAMRRNKYGNLVLPDPDREV